MLQVGRTNANCGDLEIESFTDLPATLPDLWEQRGLAPPVPQAGPDHVQQQQRRRSFVMVRNNVVPAAGLVEAGGASGLEPRVEA